jgi:hypothetical protein
VVVVVVTRADPDTMLEPYADPAYPAMAIARLLNILAISFASQDANR